MDNFNPKGHISKDGLYKLIHGEPTELERLEFAEHLSFCSQCLDAYLTVGEITLNSEELTTNKNHLAEKIIRKRSLSRLRVYLSTGLAAAAVIAFINMCLFSPDFSKNLSEKASILKTYTARLNISEKLSESIDKISDNLEFKIFKED